MKDIKKIMQLFILDTDQDYVQRLSDYMNARNSFPFEAQAFTSIRSLAASLREEMPEVVLIADELIDEELTGLIPEKNSIRLIRLTADPEAEDKNSICRYQPADRLIEQLLQRISGSEGYVPEKGALMKSAGQSSNIKLSNIKLYGVYSPVGRCGKTGFALTLASVLGNRNKVLYLNLEDYSGFDALSRQHGGGDLTDLIYFLREDREALIYRLGSLMRTLGRFDYIPPAAASSDLADVESTEWIALINEIAGTGEYDVLILDIGSQVRQVCSLLRACTKIFMPVLDDPVSRAKLNEFMKNLKRQGAEKLGDRIMRLQVPAVEMDFSDRDFPETIARGKMGEYVRRLARNIT